MERIRNKINKYKVVSLFSGIGGFDLGFEYNGFNIIWANDVESCVYQEINNTFVKPKFYDIKCDEFNEKIIEDILTKIQTKRV